MMTGLQQRWLGTMALVAFALAGTTQAATWGGGTGDWASDNWGLDAPDGYPGDANYPNEPASLTVAGEVQIGPGDAIDYGGVASYR